MIIFKFYPIPDEKQPQVTFRCGWCKKAIDKLSIKEFIEFYFGQAEVKEDGSIEISLKGFLDGCSALKDMGMFGFDNRLCDRCEEHKRRAKERRRYRVI